MKKIFTLLFLVTLFFPLLNAQNKDKKFEDRSMFEVAPINTYFGTQVLPTKDNLLSQGLNGGSVPTGWSVVDVLGTAGDITFVTTSSYPPGYVPTEGTHMARFNSYSADATKVRLQQTTSFSTTGFNSIAVNFDWLKDAGYSSNRDSVYVQWSTDGTTWNTVGGVGRYNTTAGWTAQSFTLPSGANEQTNLYIAFLFVSHYGNNCHLDNIVVTGNPVVANDLTVSSWVSPVNGSDINSADVVEIAVTNNGTANASNFNIAYSIDGGATFVTETITGTINSGATQNYTFAATANMNIYKTYNCVAAVILTGDQNTSNDTLETTITKTLQSLKDTLYTQMLPRWTGTVTNSAIVDSSYITVISGSTTAADTTGWIKFDITDIPDDAIITGVELHAYVNADNYAYFRVMSLENDPVTALSNELNADTKDGNQYYQYAANFPSPGWFVGSLAATANDDLKNNLVDNWFGVGLWEYETSAGYYLEFDGWNETNKPYLVVNYSNPLSLDVAITAISGPVSGYTPNNQITITIKNNGTTPVTEIPVNYIFGGDTISEVTPVGITLNIGETYEYTFSQTIDISTPANYSITCYHNYNGDIFPSNDLLSFSFTVWEPFYPLAVNINTNTLTACYGPIYKDGSYYVSRWNSNQIYQLDNAGNLTATLPVTVLTSAQGFRDLAYYGDTISGGINTVAFYKGTILNDTLNITNTITTGTYARGIEYDPVNDNIWICNWTAGSENLLLVDKVTGATLQTVTNPNAALFGFGGLSYDYWTPGGPYLVGFSQHNHGNQLVWIKISDGSVLVDHDVTQEIPEAITAGAISGGAFVSNEAVDGSVVLGGIIQNFRLFGFEIASTTITEYSMPGQINSNIDNLNKEIFVTFESNANLNGIIPEYLVNDFYDLSEVYINGVLQQSGVNSFDINFGDTLNYYVVRYNYDGSDSIFSNWKVIIVENIQPLAGELIYTTTDLGTNSINPTNNSYDLGEICHSDNLNFLSIEVVDDNINQNTIDVFYNGNDFGNMVYDTNNVWIFQPEQPFNWTVGVNTLTTTFVDLSGNNLDIDVNFTYVECLYDVTFNVTDGTNPIEGAVIDITLPDTSLITDASGVASVSLENGNYTFNVSATNFIPQTNLQFSVDYDTTIVNIVLIPNSIKDIDLNVVLSPNPTNDIVNISANENYTITVLDITGRVISTVQMNNNMAIINLSQQKSGMYILRLSNNNITKSFKVIRK